MSRILAEMGPKKVVWVGGQMFRCGDLSALEPYMRPLLMMTGDEPILAKLEIGEETFACVPSFVLEYVEMQLSSHGP